MTDATIDATIDKVEVSAYTIPTDAPEADGTISWDSNHNGPGPRPLR